MMALVIVCGIPLSVHCLATRLKLRMSTVRYRPLAINRINSLRPPKGGRFHSTLHTYTFTSGSVALQLYIFFNV